MLLPFVLSYNLSFVFAMSNYFNIKDCSGGEEKERTKF